MRLSLVIIVGLIMTVMSGNENGSSTGPDPTDYSGPHQAMMQAVHNDIARNWQVLGRENLSAPVALAMAKVPRHEFVPPELRRSAYANHPLPIGHGQTISQPTIVALMTDLMALGANDTVLEVGTGSGYQAAVLSEVVTHGIVHTIEIVPELAETARRRLEALAYENVVVHTGDGYLGLPAVAPFAAVMVTAAAPKIPLLSSSSSSPGEGWSCPSAARGRPNG